MFNATLGVSDVINIGTGLMSTAMPTVGIYRFEDDHSS